MLVPLQRQLIALGARHGGTVEKMRMRWFRGNPGRWVLATGSFRADRRRKRRVKQGHSTPYHVFILSRIRESFDGGMSTDEAVAHGIKTTASVVTSAALVMVGVFAIFATLSLLFLKQFGVGLAAAILIDATIVRAVLLPSTMKLLGDWNWYLPKWLQWLPRFDHGEAAEAAPPAPAAPAAAAH